MSWWTDLRDKVTNTAKNFASGIIKPIDDFLGTDFQSAWANEESKKATSAQNAFNAKEAQKQRDWQTQMSNTAHQREVADLQKAGINPVLSAGGGSGASTPSGGVATGQQRQIFTSAQRLAKAEIERIEAETNNIKANTEQTKTNTLWTPELNKATIEYNNANTAKAKAEAKLKSQELIKEKIETDIRNIHKQMTNMDLQKRNKYWEYEIKTYEAEIEKTLKDANFDNNYITEIMDWLGRRVKNLSPVINAVPTKSGNTYNFTQSAPTVNY